MTDNFNVISNDLDLEYKDVVKDPNDPQMRTIESEIPARYKDKTADELISMHVNLEKVLTRQGNELGQLRKVVDAQTQLLTRTSVPQTQTEPKKDFTVSAEKLLNEPVQTVNSVIEQNPAITSGAHRLNQLEMEVAQGRFAQANPTYTQDLNDPEFQSWVLASKIRSKLLASLNGYNFEAGNELWELWGEHKGAKTAAETARASRVQAAGVTKTGTSEPIGKPIYSRVKLMELHSRAINGDPEAARKWNDPAFQTEYQLAHAEKRVR
jgi:hypothetical protein